jgi:hypothetical protein
VIFTLNAVRTTNLKSEICKNCEILHRLNIIFSRSILHHKVTIIKLFLCLINQTPQYEGVWKRESIAPSFSFSVLDGDESSCRFIPGQTAPGTERTGGWVDPRDGMEAMEKKKSLLHAWNRTPIPWPSSP